ncbi:MAG TPA: FAD-binding protein, partial [Acidimicrobiales bacterium]|nr:FAD-binding protein [Acidimicrobiales bacterium]
MAVAGGGRAEAPTGGSRRKLNRWTNWGGNQTCAPAEVVAPASVQELAGVVKAAAGSGRRVKAVGSGHSFTDVACTDGVHVRLDRMTGLVGVDHDRLEVTVQAGMTLAKLAGELAGLGWALPN